MTTPTPTPVMTLEDAIKILRTEGPRLGLSPRKELCDLSEAIEVSIHYLEAGKRVCKCNNLKIALRDEALQIRNGIPSIGGCYIQHCPWCGGTLSPQPPQQPSPPAPYYTADGQPLQYHEVSGGGGCGAIPVEPPKQSPQT